MKLPTTAAMLLLVCLLPGLSPVPQIAPAPGEICPARRIEECSETGCGGWDRTLNIRKNLSAEPSAQPETFTLDEIRRLAYPSQWFGRRDREELAALGEGKFIVVEAAAFKVEYAGPEFSNCRLIGKRDMNLRLSLITREEGRAILLQRDREARSVTAVLTPRVRLSHPNWTLKRLSALIGRIKTGVVAIRVKGLLLLDTEPPSAPTPGHTNWVIQPVFGVDVCSLGCSEESSWMPLDKAHVITKRGRQSQPDDDDTPIIIAPEQTTAPRRRRRVDRRLPRRPAPVPYKRG